MALYIVVTSVFVFLPPFWSGDSSDQSLQHRRVHDGGLLEGGSGGLLSGGGGDLTQSGSVTKLAVSSAGGTVGGDLRMLNPNRRQ